jgi:glycosyltransferase involved in cell wall biosynthesis
LSLDYGIDVLGSKGAAVHVRSICRALASLGHTVEIHCSRIRAGKETLEGNGICVAHHPLPRDFLDLRKSIRTVYNSRVLIPPEVRQCAINRDALEYLRQAWEKSRPRVVIERLSLMGVAGLRVAHKLGIPHVLEVNALLSDEAKAHRALSDYRTARLAEDEVLQGTNRVFTVSEPLREAVIGRGVDPVRVEAMPNGYDETVFAPRDGKAQRAEFGLSDRFCVGLVGSMKSWHGVRTLLSAFEQFAELRRNAALLLVGQGPEMEAVAEFQSRHPDLPVICPGPVEHERVADWISVFDVAVAPYEKSDLFYFSPMKVYEYMAMGKPVVASSQGQIAEVLTHGENGLLFDPGDAEGLKDCFVLLYETPALRERLGQGALGSVQGHTWQANACRLLAAIREVGA